MTVSRAYESMINMKRLRVCIAMLLSLSAPQLFGADNFDEFPTRIEAGEKYLFYSHGLIVEGSDPRPYHESFGYYEFEAIKQALINAGDFKLIAQHRPANTAATDYAAQLSNWVRRLLDAGVDPSAITLIGFSRGAQITALAASELNSEGINTVLMGLCFAGDYPAQPPIALGGHVLSIYETSDSVQSCSELLARSTGSKSTSEIAISTGRGHGAFYAPRPEWLGPLRSWLEEIGF